MRNREPSGRQRPRAVWRRAVESVAVGGLALALVVPAQAQFWSPFSYGPRRPPAPIPQQQYQQQYNPFGGFFGPPQPERREAPADYSHAPAPPQHKNDVAVTTPIVVLGDAMADWLAYGLEDAYSDQPEIGVLRRDRTTSGLVRYDPRKDEDWAQAAREIIAADKPKVIVMMIGSNDHQTIRERAVTPPARTPANGKQTAAQPAAPPTEAAPTEDVPNPAGADAEQPRVAPGRNGSANATGPFEFHTDQWEAAYIKRIDATIAALKSANVPVIWVGLPAQRGPKATADASYLNELYRSSAEKAGIVFVDVWDGFVDEQGRYSPMGPDFEGQTRRLRSGDGVYFTKFGARKLAHYVEREIGRVLANRSVLVSLPSSVEPGPGTRPGGPSARPAVGPVVPLTVTLTTNGPEELLGGGKGPAPRPASADPLTTRVLTKGEALGAPSGRADDFSWPRGNVATVKADQEPPPAVAAKPATAPAAKPGPVAAATPQRSELEAPAAEPQKPRRPAPPPQRPAPFSPFSLFR